jgi:hypothetical protein
LRGKEQKPHLTWNHAHVAMSVITTHSFRQKTDLPLNKNEHRWLSISASSSVKSRWLFTRAIVLERVEAFRSPHRCGERAGSPRCCGERAPRETVVPTVGNFYPSRAGKFQFLSETFKKVEKECLEKVVPAWNKKSIH